MADLYVQPILGQPSQNKIGQRTLYCPAAPDMKYAKGCVRVI